MSLAGAPGATEMAINDVVEEEEEGMDAAGAATVW